MKKIAFLAAAMLFCTGVSAQVMKVMQNDSVVAVYEGSNYKFVFEKGEEPEPADPNILPGEFSVSAIKTVHFTKGNLYWNGSEYKFETKQYNYPTSWSAKHVGHFFWTSLPDYESGKAEYMPYASTFKYSAMADNDHFFCAVESKISVEGTANLYVLSPAEWSYVLTERPNATSLCKKGVSVAGKANCLIIAPDDYDYTTTPIKSSYTSAAWATAEAAGLVCLPAAGYRYDTSFASAGTKGQYWTSTAVNGECGFDLYFDATDVAPDARNRYFGYAIRLVR